jgi:hypothetical protein
MFELYVVLRRRGYPLSRRILLFTTVVVDLSWGDDDELGANDNLFLYVDTYKVLCSCVRHPQSTLPPTSHPLQPPTPLASLQPFDRIFSLAGKPPDYVHVPHCQPRKKSHGLLPRVSPSFPSRSNPLTLPASAAPSTFSPPPTLPMFVLYALRLPSQVQGVIQLLEPQLAQIRSISPRRSDNLPPVALSVKTLPQTESPIILKGLSSVSYIMSRCLKHAQSYRWKISRNRYWVSV